MRLLYILYLSTKRLLFRNGINFAFVYLLISDRGAKSDACLGLEQFWQTLIWTTAKLTMTISCTVLILKLLVDCLYGIYCILKYRSFILNRMYYRKIL